MKWVPLPIQYTFGSTNPSKQASPYHAVRDSSHTQAARDEIVESEGRPIEGGEVGIMLQRHNLTKMYARTIHLHTYLIPMVPSA